MAREDPAHRIEEQQRDLLHHRETRSNQQSRSREQQLNNVRRQHARSSRGPSLRALHYEPDNFYNTTDIGTLSLQCSDCGALRPGKVDLQFIVTARITPNTTASNFITLILLQFLTDFLMLTKILNDFR